MSFTASFTVSQSNDSTSIIVTDTSSYVSEPQSGFTTRRLIIYKVDGSTVAFPSGSTSTYIDFNYSTYSSDVITITGFGQDYSLRVEMDCIKSSPVSGSTYTVTNLITMIGFTMAGLYNAAQILASNPIRLSDSTFNQSLVQLQREKTTAQNAGYYGDQFSAQAALDRAYAITSQSNIRF